MKIDEFKNITVCFDKPINSEVSNYEFINNPPEIKGGALYDQVVIVREEISYLDLIDNFLEISEITSPVVGDTLSYLISSVFSLVWSSSSLDVFPDEYKNALDFVKNTDSGYSLDPEKIRNYAELDQDFLKVLDALVEHKYLRVKKNGEYVVRKKVLSNLHVSFLNIA